jgi:hypothetical protein
MSAVKGNLIAFGLIAAVVLAIVFSAFRTHRDVTVTVAIPPQRKAPDLYEANFAAGVTDEWSIKRTTLTPAHQRTMLGPFRETPVRFTMDKLLPHQFVRVVFDLVTFDRWNGDSENFGRDVWDLRVAGGQPLIHTTFSNCGFFDNNNEQSFPDQYPWYPTHVAWTGATTRQSLGYRTSQGNDSWGDDSTYHFDLTFPHSADTLALAFQSQIKNHENKPYGFLDFKVTTLNRGAPADARSLYGWWQDLSDEDPVKAYKAAWSMIATGDAAAAYLGLHLFTQPASSSPEPLNIDQQAVWDYGSFSNDTPEARQWWRALHVLEAIGTESARAKLQQLGYHGTPVGAPPDHWTRR